MPSSAIRSGADSATARDPILYTVAQLLKSEPALAEGGIRQDLFQRDINGLEESGAVVYRGRKILLHKQRYLDWMLGAKPAQRPHGLRRVSK